MTSPVMQVAAVMRTNHSPAAVRVVISPWRSSATRPAMTAMTEMAVWKAPKGERLKVSSIARSQPLRGCRVRLEVLHVGESSAARATLCDNGWPCKGGDHERRLRHPCQTHYRRARHVGRLPG